MKDKKKMMICFILVLLMNLASNIYFEYTLYGIFSFGWRMIYAFVFYCLQLLLLKYAADSNSKTIYVFPLYWGIEIWRLLFREGIITFLIPGLYKKLWRYSSIFWLSDWFPASYYPHICIYGEKPPYLQIRIETIIKIIISVMAFLFSVYAIIKRRKKTI